MAGGLEAAEQFDQMLALWQPSQGHVDQVILPNKQLADARTRDLLTNDAFVASAAQIHRDGIVGHQYVLNAEPEYELLGFTKEWSEAFQKEVEAKFNIWADSVEDGPDVASRMNLTGLLRMALTSYLGTGEILGVAEYVDRAGRSYKTGVQMVDTDRLRTPAKYMGTTSTKDGLNRRTPVVGGVRRDRYGNPLGYYIHDQKLGEFYFLGPDNNYKYVKKMKPWGRIQAFHIIEQLRPDQTRGVSELVSALKQVKVLSKFRDVTLQNAITGAMFAATIESDLPAEAVYDQLGGQGVSPESVNRYAAGYLKAVGKYSSSGTGLKLDGVRIPVLYPGTKLSMNPVGTPGAIGQEFEHSLLRYLASSVGLSYEVLSRDYTNTNYSSTRAAMLEVWRYFSARKKLITDRIANIVYRLWLEEAIVTGEIKVEIPNIYEGQNFNYLTKATWIGASKGQIDTLKETQAAIMRMKFGLTSQRQEAAQFGQDWRKLNEQLELEKKDRIAKDIEWIEAKSLDAASGTNNGAKAPKDSKDKGSTSDEKK